MSKIIDAMYETAKGMFEAGTIHADEFAEFQFLKDQDMPQKFYEDENAEDEEMVSNCTDEQLIALARRLFPDDVEVREQLHHIAMELACRFESYRLRYPQLSDEDLQAFYKALDAPPKVNKNLQKALANCDFEIQNKVAQLDRILDYAENGCVTLNTDDCPLCTREYVENSDWQGIVHKHCVYHKKIWKINNEKTIYDDDEWDDSEEE